MIISHQHKFIFIKPQKTAGTSVELMLSTVCGKDDIITPLGYDPDPNVREKYNAKPAQNYKRKKPLKHWQLNEIYYLLTKGRMPNLNFWEHLPADKIKEYVGKQVWDSYTKISIVRNPWDHAVSWFKWQEKYGYENTQKGKFEEYLINNYRSTWPFYTINYGLYDIDFMIKFESINDDIDKLFELLKINKSIELPKTKQNIRKKKNYKDFYTKDIMIDIVSQKSHNVISKFDYTF